MTPAAGGKGAGPASGPGPAGGSHSQRRARVVVTQHRLLHYRQAFFERLREACAARGIELRLVHGQASPTEALKKDTGELPWADAVRNRFLRVRGVDLVWQPYPAALRDADLVVLIQENRLLSNYPWLLRLGVGARQRVAYWGHGRNLQSASPQGLRERWKQWFVNRVDWWFAYTDSTRDILVGDGYPAARIAVLDNAIDNEQFQRDLAGVGEAQRRDLRQRLGAPANGAAVGLYCGSLYPDKKLELLLAACDIVHAAEPRFRLVVLGDGPSRGVVTEAQAARPWLQWVGVQRGADKAAWFRTADLYLSPGAVGLHVLDAFGAGLPMITTRTARHGPEVAYLKSGDNGFVVDGDEHAYAEAVLRLLRDSDEHERIRRAALRDAGRYTLAHMVQRFVEGIEGCLAVPPKGRG
ncbi:MAG: glycosyltransferase family 4 protein [Rubrivivax sp.]|nr:glycosyltransferase family 4 protein [Rubrivivax sp.]